jgi:hypothetical protein
MTRQELLDLHGTTCNKAFSIMEAKNADYTGGSEDPFANFRATEMLGVPAEIGILTRCLDKFQRIRSFTVNGTLAVKGESVDDAIEDVINYMVLLKGVIKERVDAPTKFEEAFESVKGDDACKCTDNAINAGKCNCKTPRPVKPNGARMTRSGEVIPAKPRSNCYLCGFTIAEGLDRLMFSDGLEAHERCYEGHNP